MVPWADDKVVLLERRRAFARDIVVVVRERAQLVAVVRSRDDKDRDVHAGVSRRSQTLRYVALATDHGLGSRTRFSDSLHFANREWHYRRQNLRLDFPTYDTDRLDCGDRSLVFARSQA